MPYGGSAYGGQAEAQPFFLPAATWTTVLGTGSYNGLVWGPGEVLELLSVSGIDDMPNVRSSDITREYDHGYWPGTDWLDGRTVQATFQLMPNPRGSPAAGQLDALLQEVIGALTWSPIEKPLLLFNGSYQVNVRCRKRAVTHDYTWVEPYLRVAAEFVSHDPRVYSAALHDTRLVTLTGGSGGTFPGFFPGSFGTPGSGGSAVVSNAGSFETRPVFTVYGPCQNPTIANETTGLQQTWLLTLNPGDVLVIDNDARTAMLNGSVSRGFTRQQGSPWLTLPPGSSTISFGSSSGNGTLDVSWRDAWV